MTYSTLKASGIDFTSILVIFRSVPFALVSDKLLSKKAHVDMKIIFHENYMS